ncbi:MAG: hypothetical protein N3F66_12040 [Spirochaetes bacterium]|nr:hypothetical protein [Spirochaetota bacterium]
MKFVKSLALVAVLAVATAGFAQQQAKPEEKPEVKQEQPVPEKPKLEVGGLAYIEWSKELKHSATTRNPDENYNTFAIKRVYLDFKKKLDDMWSVRVTTDVGQVDSKASKKYTETGTTTSTPESKTNFYTVFLKYAYIEAKEKLDFAEYKFAFGMISTPLIGFVDKQSDYRWLEQNYADQAKTVLYYLDGTTLKGQSIDNSADMGVSLEVSMFNKLVTITGALTNGEGYKYADEVKLGDDGKAYYGMLTIMPIKDLYFVGIYRNQDTNDKISDNYNRYMGGGVVYSDEWYKIGAMYYIPEVSTKKAGQAAVENKYKLFDSWVHVRLDQIVDMPVIVVGRYAFGENKDVDKSKVTSWAAGLGYYIANGLRAVAYFQNVKSEALDDPDRQIFVKTEVKF